MYANNDLPDSIDYNGHSADAYDPDAIREAYAAADDIETREALRRLVMDMDGGRRGEALEAMHNMVAHYDGTRREWFATNNPEMMRWIAAYGAVQDLARFETYLPDDDN